MSTSCSVKCDKCNKKCTNQRCRNEVFECKRKQYCFTDCKPFANPTKKTSCYDCESTVKCGTKCSDDEIIKCVANNTRNSSKLCSRALDKKKCLDNLNKSCNWCNNSDLFEGQTTCGQNKQAWCETGGDDTGLLVSKCKENFTQNMTEFNVTNIILFVMFLLLLVLIYK